ncbi:hypothetical protein AVEN_190720-1 [Araneus ventricosus]|uniref:Uncharacterized protein n=1 Tax=Araneus ventricosus TaxID=182803 RepID=A0A4Y2KWJ2_ARAVE|nr:hypothetical protein AVEN_190720-1 [Araneus ventricosus]
MLLLHATAHHRSQSSQRFYYNHGAKNTPVSSKFRISKTTELALHVFSSRLSVRLLFSSLLKPFSSEARGVTGELFPCDSSLSWTNHPTPVVRFPPRS